MSNIPHDLEAEKAVIGAMMLSNYAIDAVSGGLVAEDFYKPSYGVIFAAIMKLRSNGSPTDAVTVSDAICALGVDDGPATLISIVAEAPPVGGITHYAKIVSDHSVRRRLIGEADNLARMARDTSRLAQDALETHLGTLASLDVMQIVREPDDVSVEEFMNRPREQMEKWVVSHLLRRQHKLMLVGGEGSGKSWILRYVAVCAAYGIQPFRHTPQKPIRTLIVDLENPEDAIYDSFEAILRQVTRVSPQAETVNRLWWRPSGINLRSRVDLMELENVIAKRRPDLVCLGPLYAAYSNGSNDLWETAAREVQSALKTLMVRYDFGLMIEDHAPHGDSSGKRHMRPYGSAFWLRWPDIGLGMNAMKDTNELKIETWRGSRVKTDWPLYIQRGEDVGSPWPFVARWE